jgi:hypothetical protein
MIPATITFGALRMHGQEVPVAPALQPVFVPVQRCSDIKVDVYFESLRYSYPGQTAKDYLQAECAKFGCNADYTTLKSDNLGYGGHYYVHGQEFVKSGVNYEPHRHYARCK